MDDHRQKSVQIAKNCLGIEIADKRLRFLQTKHLQCAPKVQTNESPGWRKDWKQWKGGKQQNKKTHNRMKRWMQGKQQNKKARARDVLKRWKQGKQRNKKNPKKSFLELPRTPSGS